MGRSTASQSQSTRSGLHVSKIRLVSLCRPVDACVRPSVPQAAGGADVAESTRICSSSSLTQVVAHLVGCHRSHAARPVGCSDHLCAIKARVGHFRLLASFVQRRHANARCRLSVCTSTYWQDPSMSDCSITTGFWSGTSRVTGLVDVTCNKQQYYCLLAEAECLCPSPCR